MGEQMPETAHISSPGQCCEGWCVEIASIEVHDQPTKGHVEEVEAALRLALAPPDRSAIADHYCGQTQAHGPHPWQPPLPFGSTQIAVYRQCAGLSDSPYTLGGSPTYPAQVKRMDVSTHPGAQQ